jgi:hypothetical protein
VQRSKEVFTNQRRRVEKMDRRQGDAIMNSQGTAHNDTTAELIHPRHADWTTTRPAGAADA